MQNGTFLKFDQEYRDMLAEMHGDKMLFVDGHDNAIIGVTESAGNRPTLLVYSTAMVIKNLMEDGMDEEEATEFFQYNISGSWMGKYTPLFVDMR